MMLRDTIRFEASLAGQISIVNVIVDKSSKTIAYDVFDNAWRAIIQRIQNTIAYKNFPGSPNANDRGMLVVDRTDEVKLRNLLRRMRVYNPVPNIGGSGYRLLPITHIVEDAVHRDSLHSYFIQLADVNAYFLYQKFTPNSYVARKGAEITLIDWGLFSVQSRTGLTHKVLSYCNKERALRPSKGQRARGILIPSLARGQIQP